MKIVVTGTRGVPNIMGGVETHCEELFPRIVLYGHEVTVIRRDSYVHDSLSEWKGVNLIDIEAPKKKSFEAIVHTFRAINKAKKLGADVLHIHAIGPALLTPYAKVIVISDVIKNLIAKRCGRTRNVHLIYNGVPKPEICHEPEYFKELGIEEGKYILGMCRFVPEKHLHDLVNAYVRLKEDRRIPEDVRLVLAGDTDFEDDYSLHLKKMARENGVVLTGFIRGKKLHSLLTNALCYSLPSSHEGLPIALLEAMSYRLPVITSSIPANLEVGLDANCYHEVGDVDNLASKIESIVNLPLQRIDYDMGKYDWDHIAEQVNSIYKDM